MLFHRRQAQVIQLPVALCTLQACLTLRGLVVVETKSHRLINVQQPEPSLFLSASLPPIKKKGSTFYITEECQSKKKLFPHKCRTLPIKLNNVTEVLVPHVYKMKKYNTISVRLVLLYVAMPNYLQEGPARKVIM